MLEMLNLSTWKDDAAGNQERSAAEVTFAVGWDEEVRLGPLGLR